MNLLNFLIYWSTRVYEWFATLYPRGREVVLYVFSWILVETAKILLAAIQWASDRVSGALNTAWSWVIDRYWLAIEYAGELVGAAHNRIDSLYGWVSARVRETQDWVAGFVRGLSDFAAAQVNAVRDWAAALIYSVQDWAAARVIAVQDFAASAVNSINADLASIKSVVFAQNSAGQSILGTIIANPFGFVMAFVWAAFQDLLCFGLAYGLGTTKYDLPPLPDWNSKGAVGVIDTIPGIPPGAGGLAPPLESISVSGYTFTQSHPGIDLGLDNGDSVHAMHAGTVLVADFSNIGYGWNVVVSGGDWWSRYAHLQALAVRPGDKVVAGQRVGLGDSTGNSTGPHLHLELKFKGNFIDPLTVL